MEYHIHIYCIFRYYLFNYDKHMTHILKGILVFLILIGSTEITAQKAKYDGFVELGADVEHNDLYVESFFKAKLEFKLKLNDRTKVELDLRADSEDQEIILKEASVDYKFSDVLEVSIGALKKRFGREELVSREKLNTVRRSMINRYFSPLGYVSRDPGIQLKYETDSREYIGGINYNSSHNLTFMSRYSEKEVLIFNSVGGGFHVIKHLNQQGLDLTYAASLDFTHKAGKLKSDLEFFYGTDPIETAYNELAGLTDDIHFFAVKLQSAYKFRFDNQFLTGLEPVLLAAILSPNTDSMDVNKIEFLVGLNVYIDENIRFMINGDLILSNNELNKTERSMTGSNAIAQFQISW